MKKNILFLLLFISTCFTAFSQEPVMPEPVKPDTSATAIHTSVDTQPLFAGGEAAWTKYLQRNLDMSVPLSKKAPPGSYKVIIKYVVETDGSVSNISALTNNGYGTEEEAMRVIRKSPKWIPATIGGKPVRARRMQPITFYMTN